MQVSCAQVIIIRMKYDKLRLKNQLCHPLYSAANAVVRSYEPHLKTIDLTYPQYLVMMSLWEQDEVTITKISEDTFFDSGTLTPLLKRLADKGFIKIAPSKDDLRQKIVTVTKKGEKLKDHALDILPQLAACFSPITLDEAHQLGILVRKLTFGIAGK